MAGLLLWGVLAVPPVRRSLESGMVTHALQMALLVVVGGILGRALGSITREEFAGCNHFGVTGTVLALFTLAVWLLPVSLDRARDIPGWEVAKFVSLPLLAGLPLARSWSRLPPVARGALWANAIPMAIVMGWLYRDAPIRLCNNYLVGDQKLLGLGLWGVAVVLAAWGMVRALVGSTPMTSRPPL